MIPNRTLRRYSLWFCVLASFVNAVPAAAQFFPLTRAPFADEIMGSGLESRQQTRASPSVRPRPPRPGRDAEDATLKPSLLIVEDNERLGALLKQGLTAAGFTVSVLGTVGEAIRALKEETHDIVMLDRGLPDGDGLAVLTEMRSSGDFTPVLVSTARSSITDRITTLQLGADDYLAKPFALDELIARLRPLLRKA